MACLVTDDGQRLIVNDPHTFAAQFGKAFAQIFGGDTQSTFSLELVKASPELIVKLGISTQSQGERS